MFRVVILGSGASLPTLQRHCSAVAIQYRGDVHLVDCAEGTQLQWRRAGLRFGRLRSICISHLHGDHVNGLVGLMQTLSLNDRSASLTLHGPPGVGEWLKAVQRHQGVRFGYPVEIREGAGSPIAEYDGYRVEARGLDHTTRTLGYAFVEDEQPGRFDVEAARELGLEPGPLYGVLQRGESVQAPDGSTVRPEQVLGERRRGRRIAYCVDTRPCDAAIELGDRASLLIHDATFGSELASEAAGRGHSTAAEAAEVARQAHAERLLLTHVSARYGDSRPLLEEARELFPETEVARDLLEIEL